MWGRRQVVVVACMGNQPQAQGSKGATRGRNLSCSNSIKNWVGSCLPAKLGQGEGGVREWGGVAGKWEELWE